jgi:hypothetical protein
MLADQLKKISSEVVTIFSPISLDAVKVKFNKQTKSIINFVQDKFQQVEIV